MHEPDNTIFKIVDEDERVSSAQQSLRLNGVAFHALLEEQGRLNVRWQPKKELGWPTWVGTYAITGSRAQFKKQIAGHYYKAKPRSTGPEWSVEHKPLTNNKLSIPKLVQEGGSGKHVIVERVSVLGTGDNSTIFTFSDDIYSAEIVFQSITEKCSVEVLKRKLGENNQIGEAEHKSKDYVIIHQQQVDAFPEESKTLRIEPGLPFDALRFSTNGAILSEIRFFPSYLLYSLNIGDEKLRLNSRLMNVSEIWRDSYDLAQSLYGLNGQRHQAIPNLTVEYLDSVRDGKEPPDSGHRSNYLNPIELLIMSCFDDQNARKIGALRSMKLTQKDLEKEGSDELLAVHVEAIWNRTNLPKLRCAGVVGYGGIGEWGKHLPAFDKPIGKVYKKSKSHPSLETGATLKYSRIPDFEAARRAISGEEEPFTIVEHRPKYAVFWKLKNPPPPAQYPQPQFMKVAKNPRVSASSSEIGDITNRISTEGKESIVTKEFIGTKLIDLNLGHQIPHFESEYDEQLDYPPSFLDLPPLGETTTYEFTAVDCFGRESKPHSLTVTDVPLVSSSVPPLRNLQLRSDDVVRLSQSGARFVLYGELELGTSIHATTLPGGLQSEAEIWSGVNSEFSACLNGQKSDAAEILEIRKNSLKIENRKEETLKSIDRQYTIKLNEVRCSKKPKTNLVSVEIDVQINPKSKHVSLSDVNFFFVMNLGIQLKLKLPANQPAPINGTEWTSDWMKEIKVQIFPSSPQNPVKPPKITVSDFDAANKCEVHVSSSDSSAVGIKIRRGLIDDSGLLITEKEIIAGEEVPVPLALQDNVFRPYIDVFREDTRALYEYRIQHINSAGEESPGVSPLKRVVLKGRPEVPRILQVNRITDNKVRLIVDVPKPRKHTAIQYLEVFCAPKNDSLTDVTGLRPVNLMETYPEFPTKFLKTERHRKLTVYIVNEDDCRCACRLIEYVAVPGVSELTLNDRAVGMLSEPTPLIKARIKVSDPLEPTFEILEQGGKRTLNISFQASAADRRVILFEKKSWDLPPMQLQPNDEKLSDRISANRLDGTPITVFTTENFTEDWTLCVVTQPSLPRIQELDPDQSSHAVSQHFNYLMVTNLTKTGIKK